ncbi:MAG: lycopene cyclase domain-containing protein [Ginsengibacter sp.]
MKSLYLLVNFSTILIPLVFSFHPRIQFYKTWKSFFPAAVVVAIIFIIWDSVFTRLGVWSFNPRYLTGMYLFNLPIEEILFFICIPYSCVFTYYCLDKFYDLSWNQNTENLFCIFLSLILLTTGFIFIDKIYTSVTFITTAMLCLFLKFIAKINWFGKAVSIYAILLIPFLIVNGILTGTGLDEAVVKYNNQQNLGFRLLSIPIEDVFYGFEMILLNLYLYKIFAADFYKIKVKTIS